MTTESTTVLPNMRNLDKIKELTDSLGHNISYVYDDLIFLGYSEILLTFIKNDASEMKIHLLKDLSAADEKKILDSFMTKGKSMGINFMFSGKYELIENPESQEVTIQFCLA